MHQLTTILVVIFHLFTSAYAQTKAEPEKSSAELKNQQTVPKVSAVSIEEIKKYGIIISGRESCKAGSKIPVYESAETRVVIDSIPPNSFVKYERLSEIRKKPLWAPRREYALKGSEKFYISQDSLSGWINVENLMTFSSSSRDRHPEKFLKVNLNKVVCLYSSGQAETARCSALTVWESTWPENLWVLKAMQLQPINVWLYTFPQIDTLVRYDRESLAIHLGTRGGDAGDVWGTYSFYLYQNNRLSKSYEQNYDYTIDKTYSTLDCKLMSNELNQPIVLLLEKYFKMDWSHGRGGSSSKKIHLKTDTTRVNLLKTLNNVNENNH